MEQGQIEPSNIEELLNYYLYFEKFPKEKKNHSFLYENLLESISGYYEKLLLSLDTKIGTEGFLEDEKLTQFREAVKPLWKTSHDDFPELRFRINRFIEKNRLRKLSQNIGELYDRYYFLKTKLKDPSLEKEEKEQYQRELEDVSKHLYSIER
jgi:hypothetical protein